MNSDRNKENLKSWKSSPKFAGMLYSAYLSGTYSKSELILIEDEYNLSLQSGGKLEIDFEREEGVSFNPRPARLAFIQIVEEVCPCAQTLCLNFKRVYTQSIPFNNQSELEKMISTFHWVDRGRHAHLTPNLNKKELLTTLISEGELINQFSEIKDLNLTPKIKIILSRLKKALSTFK